jgi:hypothetical protein
MQFGVIELKKIVQGGSVGIRVNDDVGHNFQTKKGMRQGDPLSPIVFNVVADMLAILIARAKEVGSDREFVTPFGGWEYFYLTICR